MYDARVHDQAIAAAAPSPEAVVHLASVGLAPRLLGWVGEAFAGALAAAPRRLAQGELDGVQRELSRLERFGVQLQEAARVLNGDGNFCLEPVDLAAAARQAIAEWSAQAQARGVSMEGPSQPCVAEAVAGVVEQTLDLCIEHALHLGGRVVVDCSAAGAVPQPMLTLHVTRHAGQRWTEGTLDDLHWQLIALLAHACGGAAHRTVTAEGVVLAVALAGPSLEPLAPEGVVGLPKLSGIAGRRIVLVELQDHTRLVAAKLMSEAGAWVDAALAPESLLQELQAGRPLAPRADVLVIGMSPASERAGPLVEALRARQPRLRIVELVDDDAAFEMSVPGSDRPARVGRQSLARTLVTAVAQELDTVAP